MNRHYDINIIDAMAGAGHTYEVAKLFKGCLTKKKKGAKTLATCVYLIR